MRLITANTKSFENLSYQCDEMLSNIKEKAAQNSNSGIFLYNIFSYFLKKTFMFCISLTYKNRSNIIEFQLLRNLV